MDAHRPSSNFKPRPPVGPPTRFVPYDGEQPPFDPNEIPWHPDPNSVWRRVVGANVNAAPFLEPQEETQTHG
jgi:hypothetical protein